MLNEAGYQAKLHAPTVLLFTRCLSTDHSSSCSRCTGWLHMHAASSCGPNPLLWAQSLGLSCLILLACML